MPDPDKTLCARCGAPVVEDFFKWWCHEIEPADGHKVLTVEDAVDDKTADHEFCDFETCEIRRARGDGLYWYALSWLKGATGDPEAERLLRLGDPDGAKVCAEWDIFADNEHARVERGELRGE